MPLHATLRQPVAALLYSSLGGLALSLVVIVLISILSAGAATCTGEGCALVSPATIVPIMLVIVVLIMLYPVLYWFLFSYELAEHSITVNSGVLFREYETIDFGRMQTVDLERGPLLMLFGLTQVRVWTASADQITFSVGTNAATAHPSPDTTLLLQKDDAQRVKDLMMSTRSSGGGL